MKIVLTLLVFCYLSGLVKFGYSMKKDLSFLSRLKEKASSVYRRVTSPDFYKTKKKKNTKRPNVVKTDLEKVLINKVDAFENELLVYGRLLQTRGKERQKWTRKLHSAEKKSLKAEEEEQKFLSQVKRKK